jgi:hypothetical protein
VICHIGLLGDEAALFTDEQAKVLLAYVLARSGSRPGVVRKYGLGLIKFAGEVAKIRILAVMSLCIAVMAC